MNYVLSASLFVRHISISFQTGEGWSILLKRGNSLLPTIKQYYLFLGVGPITHFTFHLGPLVHSNRFQPVLLQCGVVFN